MVKRYIAALNARDIETIDTLLADDCRFVDSSGGSIDGRESALDATHAFFDFETGFHLTQHDIVPRGDEVLIRGVVRANNPQLATDSLWRARVIKGKLVHWQSYGADALPLARILSKRHAEQSRNEIARAAPPDVAARPRDHRCGA